MVATKSTTAPGIADERVLDDDRLLPSQFFPPHRNPASGELRLLLAVMADAIQLVGGRRRGKNVSPVVVKAAENWLRSNNPAAFGFRWYCEVLGFDAEAVRRGIDFEGKQTRGDGLA